MSFSLRTLRNLGYMAATALATHYNELPYAKAIRLGLRLRNTASFINDVGGTSPTFNYSTLTRKEIVAMDVNFRSC